MQAVLRSAACAGLAATLGASAAPPAAADLPHDTLLVLVAPWCAPCWAELARLDQLAAAAAPLTVRVLVMEEGPRARAMIADLPVERRWLPAAPERAAARAALWARTPGLPFSVATNARGAVCSEHADALDAASVRAMVQSCKAAR